MADLYSYQEAVVQKVLDVLKTSPGAAIFADPGIGKSLIALTVAARLGVRPVIVAPKSLGANWVDQIKRHTSAPVFRLDRTKYRTAKHVAAYRTFLNYPGVLVLSVESFQVPAAEWSSLIGESLTSPAICILDESTTIKNPKSNRFKSVAKIFGRPGIKRIAMSGTEAAEGPLDLFAQLEFLIPGFWGVKNFFQFKHKVTITITRRLSTGRTYEDVIGYKDLEWVEGKLKPVTARVRKSEVLDLPGLVVEPLIIELSPDARSHYDQMKKSLWVTVDGQTHAVTERMGLFAKLRQIPGGAMLDEGEVVNLGSDKIDALLDELSDTTESAIIWCAYTHEVEEVVSALERTFGPDCAVRFDGKTSDENRTVAVSSFTEGRARFFVANPQAGGRGLNLQANCSLMYWYSLPLGLETWLQACERTNRPGQTKTTVIRPILAESTLDVRIFDLLQAKEDVLKLVQSGRMAELMEGQEVL